MDKFAKPAKAVRTETGWEEVDAPKKAVAFVQTREIIVRNQPIFAESSGDSFGRVIDKLIEDAMSEGRQLLNVELEITESHWAKMRAQVLGHD